MNVSKEELISAAGQFVEAMREDFERSFDLVDFRSYVRVRFGWEEEDWNDMDGEAILLGFFRNHYDLARQPIGMRWDFINHSVESRIDLSKR